MRTKRIIILILLALTVIAGIDMWFGIFSERGVVTNRVPSYVHVQTATFDADKLGELRIQSRVNNITITGTDTNDITVTADIAINATSEAGAREYADFLEIQLDRTHDYGELKIASQPSPSSEIKGMMVASYNIIIPHDLNISMDVKVATVSLADLSGQVQLAAKTSTISGRNLSGPIKAETDITSVKLDECSGSIDLENRISIVELNLLDQPAGYLFDIEVANATFESNVPLMIETAKNVTRVSGQTNNGQNEVNIRSQLGNVFITVN